MRAAFFGVGPVNYDEFLPTETFGPVPKSLVSSRIRRVANLRGDVFKAKLTGILAYKLAVG
jgi:hypothetical protein